MPRSSYSLLIPIPLWEGLREKILLLSPYPLEGEAPVSGATYYEIKWRVSGI